MLAGRAGQRVEVIQSKAVRPGRRGVVGAWVALTMVALMGMAALVIDIGRVTVAASQVQNVVDAAALAGAAKLPEYADAEANLQRTISGNNAENAAWPVSCVPSNDVTYYGPGETVPEYGALENDENAIKVAGHTTVEYSFARVFGIEQATVTRSATAKVKAGDGEAGLLFGASTDPNVEGIRMNGASQFVAGTMHSNTKINITGTGHMVTGDIEYRYNCSFSGTCEGRIREDTVKPYPVDYTWEEFDQGPWDYYITGNHTVRSSSDLPPGRWRITGNLTATNNNLSIHDVLIVADGDISFKKTTMDRVTLVAGGNIEMQSSQYTCYQDDLFAFAQGTSSTAIRICGSNSVTEGVMYAPNGGIDYSGSNQEVHRGGLVAQTIRCNGSGCSFEGLGDGGSADRPAVELIR